MTEDSWEHRMAARASARRLEREARAKAERGAALAAIGVAVDGLGADYGWLNGWPRIGDGTVVLMGTGVYCVGCGRDLGVTCVAFEDGWQPPGPDPVWLLSQDDCPICRTVE